MRLEDTKGGPGHIHLAVLKRAKRDDRDPAAAGSVGGRGAPAAALVQRDAAGVDVADEPLSVPHDAAAVSTDPEARSLGVAKRTARAAVPSGPIVTGLAGWRKRQRRGLMRRAAVFGATALAVGFVVGWFLPSPLTTRARHPVERIADGGRDAGALRPERPLSDAARTDTGEAARAPSAAPAADPIAAPAPAAAPPADPGAPAHALEIPARQILRETLERPDVLDDTKLTLVEEVAGDRSDAATDALLAATQSSSLISAMAAVKALAGRACPHIEAPLIGLLSHTDWQRRAWAAKMLGDDGCTAARAPLRNRLGVERDERVRTQIAAAVRALSVRRR
jgi:hypothetical protein